MSDHDKSVQAKREAFLAAYAEVGTVTHAAELAGISRTSHYQWMENQEYVEKFREAEKQACDRLEQEVRRRAVTGVLEPVFYQGEQCGTVRKYSDTLLIFATKGALPQKYRENVSMEVSGPGGGPIDMRIAEMSDEELEKLLAD